MTKKHYLNRINGVYIPNNEQIAALASEIPQVNLSESFEIIVADIIEYARTTFDKEFSKEEVSQGFTDFLNQHDSDIILNLQHLNRTTKRKKEKIKSLNYIISRYILDRTETEPSKINTIVQLSKGHLLAQIISLDNLSSYTGNMKSVKVALDAPIVFNLLGLNGDAAYELDGELLKLLKEQSADFVIFQNNYSEVISTLTDAENRLRTHNFDLSQSSRVLRYAVRAGKNANFINTKISQLDEFIKQWNITLLDPPDSPSHYDEIDMRYLTDNIKTIYDNKNTYSKFRYHIDDMIETDVDTISYIFRLRGNVATASLKDCKALLLTNNVAISYASKNSQVSKVRHKIPACVTDVFLSTILWIRFPQKNKNLNLNLLMNQCSDNIVLNDSILSLYYNKVLEMTKTGAITNEQAVMLESSKLAYSLLEEKTLNDVNLFTDKTPSEILEDIEFQHNEERKKDQETINHLKQERNEMNERIFAQAAKYANCVFWTIWVFLLCLMVLGIILGFINKNFWFKVVSIFITSCFAVWTLLDWAKIIPSKEVIIKEITPKINKILRAISGIETKGGSNE